MPWPEKLYLVLLLGVCVHTLKVSTLPFRLVLSRSTPQRQAGRMSLDSHTSARHMMSHSIYNDATVPLDPLSIRTSSSYGASDKESSQREEPKCDRCFNSAGREGEVNTPKTAKPHTPTPLSRSPHPKSLNTKVQTPNPQPIISLHPLPLLHRSLAVQCPAGSGLRVAR